MSSSTVPVTGELSLSQLPVTVSQIVSVANEVSLSTTKFTGAASEAVPEAANIAAAVSRVWVRMVDSSVFPSIPLKPFEASGIGW